MYTPMCKTRKSSARHVAGFPCRSPLDKQESSIPAWCVRKTKHQLLNWANILDTVENVCIRCEILVIGLLCLQTH